MLNEINHRYHLFRLTQIQVSPYLHSISLSVNILTLFILIFWQYSHEKMHII